MSRLLESKLLYRLRALSPIISLLLLSYALLLIARNPTTGYELSIYSSTPRIFWIAIIFGLLNGIILIASCIYDQSKIWMVGLFEIILCNCSVISLYALRGYVLYFGRGDVSSLVGMAKDINNYGSFGDNIYPVISVLISQISKIMNIPVLTVSKYLPSLFLVIYFISIYCFSKSLIPDKKFILFSFIGSTPIFFAWFSTSIYPSLLSVLILPLFFYFLHKNSDYRFRFLIIIFCIMYPFFHPITAIFSFIYLIILFISEKLNLIAKRSVSNSLVLISSVSLVAWFIQRYSLLRNMRNVFLQLLGLIKAPTTLDFGIFYVNRLGFATAMRSLLLMISDDIIFYFLSLFAIIILLKKDRINVEKFSKVIICFVMGSLTLLIFFFSARIHSPKRLINLNFNMVLTPIFVGYILYKFLVEKKRNQIILVSSLIFLSTLTAISSLYPSPMTNLPNSQVTVQDITGMTWLIDEKDPKIGTAGILTSINRFTDLIYGFTFKEERIDLRQSLPFPDHFGFRDDDVLPIDENRYFIITDFDIKTYTEVWKDIDRFSEKDFIKINFCNNVNKIYENGEFRSYLVHKDD